MTTRLCRARSQLALRRDNDQVVEGVMVALWVDLEEGVGFLVSF
jgi:hypothetical protein